MKMNRDLLLDALEVFIIVCGYNLFVRFVMAKYPTQVMGKF